MKTEYKKVEGFDVVVKINIGDDGKIVSAQAFTPNQVEAMINAPTKQLEELKGIKDLFN